MDGNLHPKVAWLGSLGSFGLHPGNCNRDLMKHYGPLAETLGTASKISVECLQPKEATIVESEATVMFPHVLFSNMAQEFPEQFQDSMGTDRLEYFWDNIAIDDPRMTNNPVKDIPNYRSIVIPIFLHGDGVAYHQRDSLMTLSWGSMIAHLASVLSVFLMACWPKSCTTANTWGPLLKAVCWSLYWLSLGLHPDKDWNNIVWPVGSREASLAGKPLTSKGYRVFVMGLFGDQEYFSNFLHLPHWQSRVFCWFCNASKQAPADQPQVPQHLLWNNFTQTARWSKRKLGDDFITAHHHHPYFGLPGVNIWFVFLDVLHCLDQGYSSHVVGSALKHMIWVDLSHMEKQAALALVWERIQRLYVQMKSTTRLTNLLLGMIVGDAKKANARWPTLNAKAAETRHLVPVLAMLASEQPFAGPLPFQQHRAQCLRHLALFYDICDTEPMFMSQEGCRSCQQHMGASLSHYYNLEQLAQEAGFVGYHSVPKHHMSLHLAQQSKMVNPRFTWTYKCEDWVGQVAEMAHSCSFGTTNLQLSHKLFKKYVVGLYLKFSLHLCDDELQA